MTATTTTPTTPTTEPVFHVPLDQRAMREIGRCIVLHRNRLRETYHRDGMAAAEADLATVIGIEARPHFTADDYGRVRLFAMARALGREIERLKAIDRARLAALAAT